MGVGIWRPVKALFVVRCSWWWRHAGSRAARVAFSTSSMTQCNSTLGWRSAFIPCAMPEPAPAREENQQHRFEQNHRARHGLLRQAVRGNPKFVALTQQVPTSAAMPQVKKLQLSKLLWIMRS